MNLVVHVFVWLIFSLPVFISENWYKIMVWFCVLIFVFSFCEFSIFVRCCSVWESQENYGMILYAHFVFSIFVDFQYLQDVAVYERVKKRLWVWQDSWQGLMTRLRMREIWIRSWPTKEPQKSSVIPTTAYNNSQAPLIFSMTKVSSHPNFISVKINVSLQVGTKDSCMYDDDVSVCWFCWHFVAHTDDDCYRPSKRAMADFGPPRIYDDNDGMQSSPGRSQHGYSREDAPMTDQTDDDGYEV